MLNIYLERDWFVTNSANESEFEYVISQACEQIDRERAEDYDFGNVSNATIDGDEITLHTYDGADHIWK